MDGEPTFWFTVSVNGRQYVPSEAYSTLMSAETMTPAERKG
jgi:hypothetical protein